MTSVGTPPRDHVVYVLSGYPVISETFVRNEIMGLREAGVEVTVLTLDGRDGAEVDPAWAGPHEVLSPSSRGPAALLWWTWRQPCRVWALLRVLLALHFRGVRHALLVLPDVLRLVARDRPVAAVHCHFGWSATVPTLVAGALLDAPTSVTLHANDLYVPAHDLDRKLALFDRVVNVCRYNVDLCVARGYSVDPEVVVPCGVKVPELPSSPYPPGSRVLSVGRLVPKKGFDDLVRAFAEVVEDDQAATLEIIGDGPDRQALEALIVELGLEERVTLLGSMANPDVLDAMARCDVFVLACKPEPDGRSDAVPVVIREAMARARPVISTSVAGIPETLEGVGWLIGPSDVAALSEALREALRDVPRRSALGRAARDRVTARYTLDHTVAGMRRVLGLVGRVDSKGL